MIKTYVYANVSTKKGILQLIFDYDKKVYKKVFSDIDTPVFYFFFFGHSTPRCILPYNISTTVDYDNKRIIINESILEK